MICVVGYLKILRTKSESANLSHFSGYIVLTMTTESVEKVLEDKSPITRDSEVRDRTFNIKAVREEDGIKAEITDVMIRERFSPMLYDIRWSTESDKDTPFVGSALRNKERALKAGEDQSTSGVRPTTSISSKIALVFETVNGNTYHFKKSINLLDLDEGGLFYEIIVNQETPSEESGIPAWYKPTSDTDGELRIQGQDGVITSCRRAFDGSINTNVYSNNGELIERHRSWILYKEKLSNGTEWVECPVLRAYENSDGDNILLAVESPVGESTVFEFDVSENEDDPYWKLIDSVAEGDPVNLDDNGKTVWLRHRSRSFYNLGVTEHRELLDGHSDILSTDINDEWELRVEKQSKVSKSVDTVSGVCSVILSGAKSLFQRF